jgi:hypothetical protein
MTDAEFREYVVAGLVFVAVKRDDRDAMACREPLEKVVGAYPVASRRRIGVSKAEIEYVHAYDSRRRMNVAVHPSPPREAP